MFSAELLLSKGKNNIGCTNSASVNVTQKLTKDRKMLIRETFVEAKKLFVYDGDFKPNDEVEGVVRIEEGEKEVLKYFKGIILYLSMGLCKIRVSGELNENNIEQFLKQIKRDEYTR